MDELDNVLDNVLGRKKMNNDEINKDLDHELPVGRVYEYRPARPDPNNIHPESVPFNVTYSSSKISPFSDSQHLAELVKVGYALQAEAVMIRKALEVIASPPKTMSVDEMNKAVDQGLEKIKKAFGDSLGSMF